MMCNHFDLRLFTGLARAALAPWKLIVKMARGRYFVFFVGKNCNFPPNKLTHARLNL